MMIWREYKYIEAKPTSRWDLDSQKYWGKKFTVSEDVE